MSKIYDLWSAFWGLGGKASKKSHPMYRRWAGIVASANHGQITLDPAWRDFDRFVRDVGTPLPGTQLTAVRRDRPLGPHNWQWASRKSIARRKSNIVPITYRDRTMTAAEWAEQPRQRKLGLDQEMIGNRIKYGWSIHDAMTKPKGYRHPHKPSEPIKYRGKTMRLAQWAMMPEQRALGLTADTLRMRRMYGWSVERTMTTPVQARAVRGSKKYPGIDFS